jgi:hypothetical protein
VIYTSGYSQDTTKLPSFSLFENRITYSETVTLDTSFSKQQLFHNAEEWYTHHYQTADNTLTIENIDDGKISGTCIIHLSDKERHANPGDIFFTVDIICAKGSYMYKVYGIHSADKTGKFYYSDMYNEALYPPSRPKWTNSARIIALTDMNNRVSKMIENMKSEMTAIKSK